MIIQKSNSSRVTVISHVLVWGVFGMVLFFFQPLTWNISVPYQFWLKQFIFLGLLVGAYYFNANILVPKFLLKNRTAIYLLAVVSVAVVIILLNIYSEEWLNIHQVMSTVFREYFLKHGNGRHRPPRHQWDFAMIATIALVIGVGTSVTAIQKWQKDKQVHQELEQDRVSSELSFLKAQINPHFFFNTLNNIYALTLVNGDTSRKAIHQLSRMMRYVLYDTQNITTQLSQEIAFIKDYLSLMQLRLTDVVKIEFKSPAALKDMAVAPMIFLPFVENAFKHGVSATHPSYINMDVAQNNNMLQFKVINTIIKEQSNNLEEGSGIGLNNTRRRLDLLYPGKYTLLIDENAAENTYSVHLTLDLA
jgi:two-component system LytT family sensor kinase